MTTSIWTTAVDGVVTRAMAQQDQQTQAQQELMIAKPLCVSAARTAFFSSALCEDGHRVPLHPETFERAQVVRMRIAHEFRDIHHVQQIAPATRQKLLLFHTPKYVDKLDAIFAKFRSSNSKPQERQTVNSEQRESTPRPVVATEVHRIDEDTGVTHGTEDAALIAAGAVCDAIDLVMASGAIQNAFCGVRPPGHHAEPHRAMGFCLFNNVGIGASYVLATYAPTIARVTVLDFDVHHGNGSQAKFSRDAAVQYVSLHQAPCFPHTGKASERGEYNNILNVPLPARTGSRAYRKAFVTRVVPAIRAFQPDFVLISAGFDAHARDPLAELALETDDYYWTTQQVVALAWEVAHGRVVSVLEGGAWRCDGGAAR